MTRRRPASAIRVLHPLLAGAALALLALAPAGAAEVPILNPGFESGATGWQFSSGTGVATNLPHSGAKLAYLDAGTGLSVRRSVTLDRAGPFQVSAWVATSGSDGTLEARIGGRLVASSPLPKDTTYQRYVVGNVAARPGDVLEVTVTSATDGWVNFDDLQVADDEAEIAVASSNPKLVDLFSWAKAKANNWVLADGTVGRINVDERQPDGTGTATYRASYWAGYRHRSGYYARDMVHQMVGAQLLGLAPANKNMLRSFATSATPARGLYTVWAFNFDTATPLSIDFRGDDNFVRELPAVFELVEAVDKAWRWSGDRDYIADADFTTFARNSTTTFVDTHDSKIPNGAVKVAEGVSGDIFEGVASYNENGEGLIEAGDGIGSQYRAYLAASDLAVAGGDLRGAVANRIRAEALKLYFNKSWSDRPGVTPLVRGYAVSGATAQPVGGWGKENSWFMPMKRIVTPGARLDAYLDYIDAQATDPATRPGNIEALTYLPDTFFPYGRDATAWKWMQHIYDQRNNPHPVAAQGTNGNYPETSFTLVSQTVQGLLGVDPDAAKGLVTTRSHLPADIGWLEARNIRIGDGLVTVRHDGLARSTLTNARGGRALTWRAEFPGRHDIVKVDGIGRRAIPQTVDGVTVSVVEVRVAPGRSVTVTAGWR
ncbi:hypothetical protein [Inquilinus sp. CA228]|uniref:hypothetical protein n=1 Tax=Inquilinus sp. CA228 TaxID=3455609 RepID=UPI003F8D0B58